MNPHPGLSVFGLTYQCGFTWAGTPRACPASMDAIGVMDLAASLGLSGLEFPTRMLGDCSPDGLREVRRAADERGLAIVLAAGNATADHLLEQVEAAHLLGASVLRFTVSSILCGDRRGLTGGWPAHLDRCAQAIEAALPAAERHGTALAAENHQDATSEDLLALCRRFESPYLGVTLDAANPLAVMEEPLAFAERLAPYLKNVHLKDYRVHPAENGARLVRCALGEGVIDFPALLRLIEAQGRSIPRCIELAALQARLIPFLERSWWDEYPARDAGEILPALAVYWNHARPAGEEWRTPFERDEEGETLAAYERQQLEASVRYLNQIYEEMGK